MRKFIVKRLIMTIFVVIAATIVVFTLMYFIPGDPALSVLGANSTEEMREAWRNSIGLNDPFGVRLWNYLIGVFTRFDLGTSYQYGVSVASLIAERLPRTIILGLGGVIVGLVGIPLGIVAARHQGTVIDQICLVLALAGSAIPGFWLALMMVIVFSVNLNVLPAMGINDGWLSYVLPIASTCLGGIGMNARQTRANVLEVMRADFVTSARAKGCSEHTVTYKHMLPNALIPVVTVIGSNLAMAFAGSIVTEQVFSIPGIGALMINSINAYDYSTVMGCVVLEAMLTSVIMLGVDIVYAFIDPRIMAQYKGKGKSK